MCGVTGPFRQPPGWRRSWWWRVSRWILAMNLRGSRSNSSRVSRKQSWWRHQMETFSTLLAICVGNSLVTGEFPTQRPVMFSFICTWINDWVNNREAGDLGCHCAHYDITVMVGSTSSAFSVDSHLCCDISSVWTITYWPLENTAIIKKA